MTATLSHVKYPSFLDMWKTAELCGHVFVSVLAVSSLIMEVILSACTAIVSPCES